MKNHQIAGSVNITPLEERHVKGICHLIDRMGIIDNINKDLISAVKAGDKVAIAVLRMLKSSAAKKRRESIESFTKGGRDDLVAREQAELEMISRYLPEQISDSQLEELVSNVISEVNASTPADLGQVMKNIMPKVIGRADGRRVNEMVRKKLGG